MRVAVFEELHSFPHGPADPDATLVRGPDGAFYGTTVRGVAMTTGQSSVSPPTAT
jgi:hypothetical protein